MEPISRHGHPDMVGDMHQMSVLFLSDQDVTYDTGYRVRLESEIYAVSDAGVKVELLAFVHARRLILGLAGAIAFHRTLWGHGCPTLVVPVLPDFGQPRLITIVERYKQVILRILLAALRPDVVHCHGTSAAALAVGSSNRGTIPILFDMHGACIEEIGHSRLVPQTRADSARARASEAEKIAMRGADAIVSVSSSLESYWRSKYLDSTKASLILPCAVDMSRFSPLQKGRASIRRSLGLRESDIVFVYCGSAAPYQQLGLSLKVFSQVLEQVSSARLLLLLSDGDIHDVDRLVRQYGVPLARIAVRRLKRADVPNWLSAADIGLLLREDLTLNRVAFPTKFGEYLACGVPVVTTPYIDALREVIQHYGVGYILDPTDRMSVEGLVQYATGVTSDRDSVARMCKSYVSEELCWRRLVPRLIHTYRQLRGAQLGHSHLAGANS